MFKVILTDTFNDYSKTVFRTDTRLRALDIAYEMNRLNREAARLTGQALRYIYSFVEVK